MTAPLTQGSQGGAEQNLHRAGNKRQLSGFVGNFDTGLTQYMYRRDLKAPLKKPPLCKGRWVGFSRAGGVAY